MKIIDIGNFSRKATLFQPWIREKGEMEPGENPSPYNEYPYGTIKRGGFRLKLILYVKDRYYENRVVEYCYYGYKMIDPEIINVDDGELLIFYRPYPHKVIEKEAHTKEKRICIPT